MTLYAQKHHNCPTCTCTDPLDALPAAQVADPAQIRADALREVLALVRGYLDAWDDTDINGSSISIIYDAIIALIDTPPAVSDDVAALVDMAEVLVDRLITYEAIADDVNAGREYYGHVRPALVRFSAALAKMKGGA